HRLGQCKARRPCLPEQAPLGRRDPGALGIAVRVGELLCVAERAHAVVQPADADFEATGFVARHGHSRGIPPRLAGAWEVEGSEAGDPWAGWSARIRRAAIPCYAPGLAYT